jgi:hypothetical protein
VKKRQNLSGTLADLHLDSKVSTKHPRQFLFNPTYNYVFAWTLKAQVTAILLGGKVGFGPYVNVVVRALTLPQSRMGFSTSWRSDAVAPSLASAMRTKGLDD